MKLNISENITKRVKPIFAPRLKNLKNIFQTSSLYVANKDIFIVLVIILVAFGSFGLGRLSKIEESREPIRIENLSQEGMAVASQANPQAIGQVSAEKGKYVASKNGTKYYLPWCSGVGKISEANKIWFQTKEEAAARGLTPAANCPGI